MTADSARTEHHGSGIVEFAALHDIGDIGMLDVGRLWRQRMPEDRLRIPIGLADNDSRVVLDLKPASEGGMGPHGLIVGAIGSGKSELLVSILLGLAIQHSPEEVNFLLTSSIKQCELQHIRDLPHTVGYLRGVDDELEYPGLVDRLLKVVIDKVSERVEHIRSLGSFDTFSDYRRAVTSVGAVVDSLPALVVVIDEYGEIDDKHRERFSEMVTHVGRFGGLAGVHLLLTTQRWDTRLVDLGSLPAYRICQKSWTPNESRSFIGIPDAYALPDFRGFGYLRAGGALTRFQATHATYCIRTSEDDDRSEDQNPLFAAAVSAALRAAAPRLPRPLTEFTR